MWFHFCTANHNQIGRSTLNDMYDWFHAGLLDLGHKVTFSESQVEPGAINLFWEYFTQGMAEEIKKTGVVYGIIATEIPDDIGGFNWREEPEWKERFAYFHEVASGSSFIWTMVESTVPYYSQFCPTAFIELGFSERLIPSYINHIPEFDFTFFGLRTPYRIKVAERLQRYAGVEWPEKFLTPHQVGSLIAKTRVGLNFKQSEHWPIPSPTRLGRFMMAKRDVASEATLIPTRQGQIIGMCPNGIDFVDFALNRLNSNWQERAENTFDEYRKKIRMRDVFEKVLSKTIESIDTSKLIKVKEKSIKHIRQPELIKTIANWNIVCWNDEYFALLRGADSVDVRSGIQHLKSVCGTHSVHFAYSLAELEDKLKNPNRRFQRYGGLIMNFIRSLFKFRKI